MKVTDIWNKASGPTISFELFPARSEKGRDNLEKAIDDLAGLNPDFVSVTFGAGGSTRDGSFQLVENLKNKKSLEVIAYFACYGLGPHDITDILDAYMNIGIENILTVRGDIPKDDINFKPHPQSFIHTSELISYIRPRYSFCIGAAGYPEGHIEAENKDKDLEFLKLKVLNGAEYIITNYFYDNQYYFDFIDRCGAKGITVPVIPGIMPIYNIKMMEMLAGLCGATITDEIRQRTTALPIDDKKALIDFGVEYATQKCRELINYGVPGLHFYTMDKSVSSIKIIQNLRDEGLLPS
ncbi:MAG: methylenetetrahydrofolate reductase [Chitinispirillia bacterium]|jgi:methylenetetrahydrofolate reductase (NADPH)